MSEKGRIVLVDDDETTCEVLGRALGHRGFEVTTAARGDDALEVLRDRGIDVLVTDLRMRGMDGITLCRRALEIRPGLPVIVITAFGSLDTAVSAIRAGAYDFVTKPFDLDAISLALERAVAHARLRDEVRRLEEALASSSRCDDLLGESPPMKKVFDLLRRIGDSEATVLITGESGTGKELAARALHRSSPRGGGPFVALNCAAVPEHLLESELFGHARGAFTDARSSRAGLLVAAKGGTLFLDEVGDMPLGMQVKLLRALQERRIRPVGSESEVDLDVRVIAATHRDLEAEVQDGRFREDLYFRLNVIQIELPPLRARGTDVLLLAHELLRQSSARARKGVREISTEAARKLLAYQWPGNVRELANCMERAVALARFDHVTADDLPARVRDYRPSHVLVTAEAPTELVTLDEVERRYVLHVLGAAGGRRSEAARILGVDRKTLYRKLERWKQEGSEGDD
ncbi:MAG: sigma-54-dependent Fis family transcriptional regulator [Deltaproteobacteria bacterium]|nr:sigma-54-dependent Fis family transcriptional regulator [Deltaproteobacteria bacterium]